MVPPTEPQPTPAPEQPQPEQHRRRLSAVFGSIFGIVLFAACFVPWVKVDLTQAERVHKAVALEITGVSEPTRATKDFAQVFETLGETASLSGVDLFQWCRAARGYRENIRAGEGGQHVGDLTPQIDRALLLFAIALASIPIGGLLLALYFLIHRFRRNRSPVLILAALIGALAMTIAGAYERIISPIHDAVQPGVGFPLLLVGGAGFLLVATFGVTRRNFWRVYLGAGFAAVGLALLASVYVQQGTVP